MKAIAFMAALATLDLVGTLLARRFSQTGSAFVLLAGLTVFGVLFVVYSGGIGVSHLSVVTIGWITLLQIGVVIIDLAGGDLRMTPALGAVLLSTLVLQVALVRMVPS